MKYTFGLLFVLAISLCVSSVIGFTARVNTASEPLRVRASPNTHSNIITMLGPNSEFDVGCQLGGDSITGLSGTTDVWYHVPSKGGFVSGAFVSTGGQSAPSCGPARANTGSTTLNIRASPSSHAAFLGAFAANAELDIDCQANGETITGLSGTTSIWYHVVGKGYVSGAWVSTGGRSYSACDDTPAPTPAPTTSNANCDAGLSNPRNCAQAVAWAEAHLSTAYNADYRRKCDHVVGLAFGHSASGFYSALVHWQNTPERFRHYDRTPPAGALVFFRSGEYGHACLSTGGGNVISTDINGPGTLTRSSISAIEHKWSSPYLGWTNPYFHNA